MNTDIETLDNWWSFMTAFDSVSRELGKSMIGVCIPSEDCERYAADKIANIAKILNKDIFDVASSHSLNLSYRNMIEFHDDVYNMTWITSIEATNSDFEIIGESISKLTSLLRINMPYCKIKKLPDSISELKTVRYLNFTSNELKSLPHNIGEMKSIRSIYLNLNNIEELPDSICDLPCLKYLYLENNKLSKLPENIYKLFNLQELVLSGNSIDEQEQERIKKALPNCEIIIF